MKVRNISKKPIFIGSKTFVMQNEEMPVDKKYASSPALRSLIDHGFLIEVPDDVKPERKVTKAEPTEAAEPVKKRVTTKAE